MTIKTPDPHVNDPYSQYSHGRSWAPHKDFILISGVYDNDISNQLGKTIAADLADVMLNKFKISFKKD